MKDFEEVVKEVVRAFEAWRMGLPHLDQPKATTEQVVRTFLQGAIAVASMRGTETERGEIERVYGRLRRAEAELGEAKAPLTELEWRQLHAIAAGSPYPTEDVPDEALAAGLRNLAQGPHARIVFRRLLERVAELEGAIAQDGDQRVRDKMAVDNAEHERDTARRELDEAKEANARLRAIFEQLCAVAGVKDEGHLGFEQDLHRLSERLKAADECAQTLVLLEKEANELAEAKAEIDRLQSELEDSETARSSQVSARDLTIERLRAREAEAPEREADPVSGKDWEPPTRSAWEAAQERIRDLQSEVSRLRTLLVIVRDEAGKAIK